MSKNIFEEIGDVKLEIDRDYDDVGESEFFVHSVKVVDVENDNAEPMEVTYDVDRMEKAIQSLLRDVMNRSYTSQDERNLILALS